MRVFVIRAPRDLITPEVEDRETEGWCVQNWRDDGEVIMVRMPVPNSKQRRLFGRFYATLTTVGLGDMSDTLQKLHIRPEVERPEREQVAQTPITEYVDMETGQEFKVSADRSRWEQVAQTPITEYVDMETVHEFKISTDRYKIPIISFFAHEISEIRRNWRQKP